MATEILRILLIVKDLATAPLKVMQKTLKKIDETIQKNRRGVIGFGLAWLFAGMAMKKVFGAALRSIWNTYKEIIDVNDQFFQATQRLNAAWQFFKFTLIDALAQSPMFMSLIETAIQLVNLFGQLSPQAKETLMKIIIFGFAAGTIMMFLGQVVLFVSGSMFLLGAATMGWIGVILLAIVIFLIFRNKIKTGVDLLNSHINMTLLKLKIKFMEWGAWLSNMFAGVVNWIIRMFNKIPGISIGYRATGATPEFMGRLEMARMKLAGMEEKRPELEKAYEEAYGPIDLKNDVSEVVNTLKELGTTLKDSYKEALAEKEAIVIPSSMQ